MWQFLKLFTKSVKVVNSENLILNNKLKNSNLPVKLKKKKSNKKLKTKNVKKKSEKLLRKKRSAAAAKKILVFSFLKIRKRYALVQASDANTSFFSTENFPTAIQKVKMSETSV